MSNDVDIANNIHVYDSISLKVKASQPFKISVQVRTSNGSDRWITYSFTNSDLNCDQSSGTAEMVELGIGSQYMDGQWHTIERNLALDLEEARIMGCVDSDFGYINKISLLGSDFGVGYVNVWCEEKTEGGSKRFSQSVSNFGLPDITSPSKMGWDFTDPDAFSIQYDQNLTGYLQARGETEGEDYAVYSQPSTPTVYSPTDAGSSYYSPYSATGGYYDNYYGSSWYGYGGYGLGYGYPFGMGYAGYGLGGYGLGGYGLGGYAYPWPMYGIGYGLGGYALPYSSYGYPYSIYGGALGSALGAGAGISPLLAGLAGSSLFGDTSLFSSSGLLSSLADLPTNTVSIPTLVPSTTEVSLSSLLGLGGLGITGLSDITIPAPTYVPGSTTITLPDLSTFLSSTSII